MTKYDYVIWEFFRWQTSKKDDSHIKKVPSGSIIIRLIKLIEFSSSFKSGQPYSTLFRFWNDTLCWTEERCPFSTNPPWKLGPLWNRLWNLYYPLFIFNFISGFTAPWEWKNSGEFIFTAYHNESFWTSWNDLGIGITLKTWTL